MGELEIAVLRKLRDLFRQSCCYTVLRIRSARGTPNLSFQTPDGRRTYRIVCTGGKCSVSRVPWWDNRRRIIFDMADPEFPENVLTMLVNQNVD